MVNINNISTIKELRKAAQIPNSEGVPLRLAESIVPVININPAHDRSVTLLRTATRTATGVATIYTTDTIKRTFITGITLSLSANVTADNTSAFVTATLLSDVTARTVLLIEKQSVTAVSGLSLSVSFPVPLELNPGSVISHTSTFTVGGASYTTSIYGYEVDGIEA